MVHDTVRPESNVLQIFSSIVGIEKSSAIVQNTGPSTGISDASVAWTRLTGLVKAGLLRSHEARCK